MQNVVERAPAREGCPGTTSVATRASVWEWKSDSGGKILGQARHLGDNVDRTRKRFATDSGLS